MKIIKGILALCLVAGFFVTSGLGAFTADSKVLNAGKEPKTVKAEKSANVTDDIKMNTASVCGKTYYLIDNEAQLRAIGTGKYSLSAMYMLNSNIDLSSKEWTPIGNFDNPFQGTFNGNGYKIRNLTMTDPSAKLIGFFGYAKEANIGNITLRDVDIATAGGTGKSVGPIVVFAENCEIHDNEVFPKK